MGTTARLALVASATFAFATIGAVVPAQAVTAHCDPGLYKVETDGAGPTVMTDLAPGSVVCIKSSTRIQEGVVVAQDGTISNTTIKNKNGVLQGISYYVVTCDNSEGECGPSQPS